HNRPDLLRPCLASVTRHAPAGTEVLVVDDGSPGGRAGAAAAAFAGVRTLRLARRRGLCAAANAGVAAATGDIVGLLHDDTREAALACFDGPEVGAVAPLVLCWPDGDRVDSAGDRYYLGGVAAKRGHGERPGDVDLRRRAVFGASASSGFYRRAALLRIGAFPE